MSTATNFQFVGPENGHAIPTPLFDPDAAEIDPVEVARLGIYGSRGWTRVDKNGRTVPDDEAAKNFVYLHFRDHVVVNSDSDIADDGMSDTDLFAKTFPGAPGATSDSVDEVQYEAYKSVVRKLWQYAGTGIRAHCQETAEMEGLDYVMCEKKVFRASRDVSTGTGAPRQVNVRFFTSNPDLIFHLSSQPATAKLVKAAEETAKHLRMNIARHPELISRVGKDAKLALQRSNASLLAITTGKATSAAEPDES